MEAVARGTGSTLANTSSSDMRSSLSTVRLQGRGGDTTHRQAGACSTTGLGASDCCDGCRTVESSGGRATAVMKQPQQAVCEYVAAAASSMLQQPQPARHTAPHLMTSKGTGSVLSRHFWNSSTYSSGNRVGLQAGRRAGQAGGQRQEGGQRQSVQAVGNRQGVPCTIGTGTRQTLYQPASGIVACAAAGAAPHLLATNCPSLM